MIVITRWLKNDINVLLALFTDTVSRKTLRYSIIARVCGISNIISYLYIEIQKHPRHFKVYTILYEIMGNLKYMNSIVLDSILNHLICFLQINSSTGFCVCEKVSTKVSKICSKTIYLFIYLLFYGASTSDGHIARTTIPHKG